MHSAGLGTGQRAEGSEKREGGRGHRAKGRRQREE